jgi:ElaB/YqjD/DUF883 family membrane-anchored ribosome-binding protein
MTRRSERELTQAGDHIMKNVRGFMGGVEELLRATAHVSGENLAATRARVGEQLEELREVAGDAGGYALERAREAAVTTDRYVHKYPWQAIGVAMAAGIALGFLSRRN